MHYRDDQEKRWPGMTSRYLTVDELADVIGCAKNS